MDSKLILSKLNSIFQNVFDDDTLQITNETTADDIKDWDSVAHITIIAMIEKNFGVQFSIEEIAEMKKVGDMVSAISKKSKSV